MELANRMSTTRIQRVIGGLGAGTGFEPMTSGL